jgi:hypothetical protein
MDKVNYKLSKPTYREESVNGRVVTLCHVSKTIHENGTVFNTVGFSIKNPLDNESELGKTISYGRAIKSPLLKTVLVSAKALPKVMIAEQLEWSLRHIENNFDDFVERIRETIKG